MCPLNFKQFPVGEGRKEKGKEKGKGKVQIKFPVRGIRVSGRGKSSLSDPLTVSE